MEVTSDAAVTIANVNDLEHVALEPTPIDHNFPVISKVCKKNVWVQAGKGAFSWLLGEVVLSYSHSQLVRDKPLQLERKVVHVLGCYPPFWLHPLSLAYFLSAWAPHIP